METSSVRKTIARLLTEQSTLQSELLGTRGPLVAGSLHERFTSCRKGDCKCTRGEKHGPFLYVSRLMHGKTVQRYVGKPEDTPLVKKLERYKKFRKTVGRLREVDDLLVQAWRQLEESLIAEEIV